MDCDNAWGEEITAEIWKADALERMADDDRVIKEQAALIAEMHAAISKMADALHVAQMAINAYIEVKNEHLKPRKRVRK